MTKKFIYVLFCILIATGNAQGAEERMFAQETAARLSIMDGQIKAFGAIERERFGIIFRTEIAKGPIKIINKGDFLELRTLNFALILSQAVKKDKFVENSNSQDISLDRFLNYYSSFLNSLPSYTIEFIGFSYSYLEGLKSFSSELPISDGYKFGSNTSIIHKNSYVKTHHNLNRKFFVFDYELTKKQESQEEVRVSRLVKQEKKGSVTLKFNRTKNYTSAQLLALDIYEGVVHEKQYAPDYCRQRLNCKGLYDLIEDMNEFYKENGLLAYVGGFRDQTDDSDRMKNIFDFATFIPLNDNGRFNFYAVRSSTPYDGTDSNQALEYHLQCRSNSVSTQAASSAAASASAQAASSASADSSSDSILLYFVFMNFAQNINTNYNILRDTFCVFKPSFNYIFAQIPADWFEDDILKDEFFKHIISIDGRKFKRENLPASGLIKFYFTIDSATRSVDDNYFSCLLNRSIIRSF